MTVNIVIERDGKENNASVLRNFRSRFRSMNMKRLLMDNRFAKRNVSDYTKKQSKLKRLERKAEYEKLVKLGKISG